MTPSPLASTSLIISSQTDSVDIFLPAPKTSFISSAEIDPDPSYNKNY
jgi:hypothetical protein